MTRGILSGLEHLHSRGVIHRDLKPANILLQADTPRIADFGIARLAKSTATNSALSAGTPSYMAPECFYSVRSEQTDIWAVGILFHKLLTGKLPFAHPDQVSVMNAILNSEPDIDPTIPAPLQQIIRRALQKDTTARYKTAAEMREELNNFNLASLADEDTIPETVVPTAPVFEKEEETIVRPRTTPEIPQAVQPVVYIPAEEPARRRSSGSGKAWTIVLASVLVLAAFTAWAALQYAGGSDSDEKNSGFSNSNGQWNGNSNLSIPRGGSIDDRTNGLRPLDEINTPQTTTTGSTVIIPGSEQSTTTIVSGSETETNGETAAPTLFDIQPDEITPTGNRARPQRNVTPATEGESSPKSTPPGTATPIPVEPNTAAPSVKRQKNKPAPRPTAAQTEETPPPIERNILKSSGN